MNKATDLSLNLAVSLHSIDILIFTETWLSPSFTDSEPGLTVYSIYRQGRLSHTSDFRRVGGVLIAVRNPIEVVECTCEFDIELLYLRIKIGEDNLIIGGVYLPPKSPKHKYLTHLDSLESLSQAHADHNVMMFGDLNLPGLRWINDPLHTEYVGYVPPEQRDIVSSVCATYSCIGLSQLYPLHPMKNYTLDVLFASPSTISIIKSARMDIMYQYCVK